jgi:arylsulfatase
MIEPTLIQGRPISDYTRTFTRDAIRNRGQKPNIIILLPDQQRHDTIRAMGCPWAQTPGFDRLVREGVAFRNAYSPNPVCIPARHNLLTGLPGRFHGLLDNSGAVVDQSLPRIPRLLAERGYHCGGIGKFHFNSVRTHHGFHELLLMEEIPRYARDDQYLQYLRAHGYGRLRNLHGIRNLLYLQPQRSLVPEEHHGTTWVGDESLRFIRENANRPFFLQAGFIAPHPPFNCPERWAERCRDALIPPPSAARSDPVAALARAMHEYDDPRPEKIRRTRELYHGAVWHVDHQVDRILALLDELGLAHNTLVITCSDHGEMLGDLGAWGKSLPYEGACHTPLILRFPARLAPAMRSEFADLNDLLPTCCDAAGISPPAGAPGESLLLPATQGTKDRSVQYAEHQTGCRRWVMARTERYKLVHWYVGREELFDLEQDPQEQCDLLAGMLTPTLELAYRALRAQLLALEERWGVAGCVTQGEFTRPPQVESDWLPGAKPLEWQFQYFFWGESEAQRQAMDSERAEVLRAIAREPLTELSRLDLAFYLSAGGDPELVAAVVRPGAGELPVSTPGP